MSGGQYFRDQLPRLGLHLFAMAALSVFLLAAGNTADTVLVLLLVWAVSLVCALAAGYMRRRRELERLLHTAGELKERYLLPEVLPEPVRADDRVFFRLMRMQEAAMLERIRKEREEQGEYREYVEQWIHEVKTPISAMKLACENQKGALAAAILPELEKTARFAEQALYCARSAHPERDYLIREVRLADIVHQAVAENKYLLRQRGAAVEVRLEDETAYTDEKWMIFIVSQMISNAVKYSSESPRIVFAAEGRSDGCVLFVGDNGAGIPGADLPRIFDKGFTGENGRRGGASTGMGLYLCRKLCKKLGVALSVRSEQGRGTQFSLGFYTNPFVIREEERE